MADYKRIRIGQIRELSLPEIKEGEADAITSARRLQNCGHPDSMQVAVHPDVFALLDSSAKAEPTKEITEDS